MHNNHCLIEVPLVAVFRISLIQPAKALLRLFDQAVVAHLHQLRVINRQMAGSCKMVEVCLEDLLAGFGTLDLFVFQPYVDHVVYGFSLPVFAEFDNLFSLLVISYVELVVFTLLKRRMKNLIDNPVYGEFRIDRRRLHRCGNLTQN